MGQIKAHLQTKFLAGALAAIPVAVTAFIFWYADTQVRQIFPEIQYPVLGIVVALAAIYLLQPMEPGTQGQPAVRVPVNPVEALMSILKNTTLAPLLGGTEAATLFRRAHDIVAGVPAYQLRYVRDFELLPRVVEQLIDWHAPRDALVRDA